MAHTNASTNVMLKLINLANKGLLKINTRFQNVYISYRSVSDQQIGFGYLDRGKDKTIAYQQVSGNPDMPGIVFCGGFQSNMQGTKATALDKYCRENDLSFIRFDYQGCGQSNGDIREATLTDWRKDAVAVLDQLTAGPQILIGSSMGGLVMLHTYLQRPHRIEGLLGISTSADFPERRFSNYPGQILETVERDGIMHYNTDQHSYIFTKKFLDDAKDHSILNRDKIPITCQVRLLHGLCDDKVPFQISMELAEKIMSTNVHVLLRKTADHRFSQPDDITVLFEFLNCMVHGVDKVKDLAMQSWQAFTVYSHHRGGEC